MHHFASCCELPILPLDHAKQARELSSRHRCLIACTVTAPVYCNVVLRVSNLGKGPRKFCIHTGNVFLKSFVCGFPNCPKRVLSCSSSPRTSPKCVSVNVLDAETLLIRRDNRLTHLYKMCDLEVNYLRRHHLEFRMFLP